MDYSNLEEKSIARPLVNLLVAMVTVIAIAWFIVYAFGKNVISSGQSMEPTIMAENTVLVDRVRYEFIEPARYDVIAFYLDDSGYEEGMIEIKRILGLPGETIQIKDGIVYADGKILSDERVNIVELAGLASEPVRLDDDEYFVLGDNVRASEDSRFASIGNIKREDILGKVWVNLFPISEIKRIQ